MNRVGQLIAKLKGIVWELENTKMDNSNIAWHGELEDICERLNEIEAHWSRYGSDSE